MNISDVVAEAVLSGRGDAIIAADRAGIIRFWNPGAERLFGYAHREALEQSLNLIIPERLRQRHWDGYNHVLGDVAHDRGPHPLGSLDESFLWKFV